jgi:hypothetical protein
MPERAVAREEQIWSNMMDPKAAAQFLGERSGQRSYALCGTCAARRLRDPLGETGKISKHISEQGKIRADDGNRTRMTSLEGVLHLAVRAAELGGSLSSGDRD